jgi:hypothetical protein
MCPAEEIWSVVGVDEEIEIRGEGVGGKTACVGSRASLILFVGKTSSLRSSAFLATSTPSKFVSAFELTGIDVSHNNSGCMSQFSRQLTPGRPSSPISGQFPLFFPSLSQPIFS